MDRRDFLFLSILLGLSSTFGKSALADQIKEVKLKVNDYQGPLLGRILAVLDRLDRQEITGEQFIDELNKMYSDFDLDQEFGQWYPEVPVDGSAHRPLFKHEEKDRYYSMDLYYVAARSSTPPHGHHRLLSTQTVLKGELELRQYDRVQRVDPQTVLLRPTRSINLAEKQRILMTEDRDNVHWFGTREVPALIFNFQVWGIPGPLFDPDRKKVREYLDPTGGRDENGLILGRQMSSDEAFEKFSKKMLSDFPE